MTTVSKDEKMVLFIWFKFYHLFKYEFFSIGEVRKKTKSKLEDINKNIDFLLENKIIQKKSSKSNKYRLLFPEKYRKYIYELEKGRLLNIIKDAQNKIEELNKNINSLK